MAQPLLHTGQQRFLVAGLHENHAAGNKPCLGERRREQVLARDTPEHLAAGARRNAGGEQGRRSAIDRSIPAARDLMQAAKRQPSPGSRWSISASPKGRTVRARPFPPSSR